MIWEFLLDWGAGVYGFFLSGWFGWLGGGWGRRVAICGEGKSGIDNDGGDYFFLISLPRKLRSGVFVMN